MKITECGAKPFKNTERAPSDGNEGCYIRFYVVNYSIYSAKFFKGIGESLNIELEGRGCEVAK